MSDQKNDKNADASSWNSFLLIELQSLRKEQSITNEKLNEYNISLNTHMSQTQAVKEIAVAAAEENKLLKQMITNELEPIKSNIYIVQVIVKWALPSGLLFALPAAIYYILKILEIHK